MRVPHLSPTTLTTDEQRLILRATAGNVRDHTIISLALGTGLRLAEVVGLDVGDVFALDGTPRVRVRVRAAIAKGGRAADVFLPDRLTRLVSLPLLATVIQEEILALQPVTSGRNAITERTLRAIVAEPVWKR